VREPDGLAMSSRNAYLKPFERENAPLLYENLKLAAQELNLGSAPRKVLAATQKRLGAAGFRVDYVKLCNAETLAPVTDPDMEPKRLLAAVWIGKARLIDNIPV
jgi:pantoate--beta-alanine ligase